LSTSKFDSFTAPLCTNQQDLHQDSSFRPNSKRLRADKKLQSNITNILNPSAAHDKEQRVRIIEQEQQQRVIDDTPICTIPRITIAPPIMHLRNPAAKRNLKHALQIH
jgi:hypothetical protein